jgi:hypothetical protein
VFNRLDARRFVEILLEFNLEIIDRNIPTT